MRDYIKVLDIIRKKIDKRMEINSPKSGMYESAFSDESGNYIKDYINFFEGWGWTKSFLTVAVAYMYYHYKDEKYLRYLEKELPVYEEYQYFRRSGYFHDMGFLFTLYSSALYEVSGNKEAYRISIKAADDVGKGYMPAVGMLDGFSGAAHDTTNPIIDDMMNMLILVWAWKKTKHPYYYRIFTSHIKKVKQYMLRDDFTFRHSFLFESATGAPLGERNYCGFAPGSVWARGQMWAFYGLISALKATGNVGLYGDTINGQLTRLISLLDDEVVPLWDFNCVSEKADMRDSSAGIIMAAALLKLNDVEDNMDSDSTLKLSGKAQHYNEIAEKMLDKLLDDYMYDEGCTAIIKSAQVGYENRGSVWGDYFLVEALMKKNTRQRMP